MRPGISIILSPADRRRLEALVGDRNVAQKHVWRARIVLHSADGIGTNGIMRRTSKSKTCVWRWQERFAQEGYDGLLRDKTRPSRIPPLGPEVAERVVSLTCAVEVLMLGDWRAAAGEGGCWPECGHLGPPDSGMEFPDRTAGTEEIRVSYAVDGHCAPRI